MNQNKFPPGSDSVVYLDHYEHQTKEEAVVEDEAAYKQENQSMVEIPYELVPKVRNLIAQHRSRK